MSKLLLAATMCASVAQAGGTDDARVPCCQVSVPKPKVVYRTKVVHVPAPVPVATPSPCCDKRSDETVQTNDQKQVNSQRVIVNVPEQKPYIVEKIVQRVVERKVTRYVVTKDPNRLFFVLGVAKTKFEASADCCRVSTKTSWKPDAGVGYLRDFGHLTVGGVVTLTPSAYLAVGFNW